MKCLNWKVVAGLAATALAVWVLAPGLVAAALPLLVLAACPLSMLVMMRAMGMGSKGSGDGTPGRSEAEELALLRDEVAALRESRGATDRPTGER